MQAICLAMIAACALSCDKNDDAPAQPLLSEVIYDTYWDVDFQFVYEENGKTELSDGWESYGNAGSIGGWHFEPEYYTLTDAIYLIPSNGGHKRYKNRGRSLDEKLGIFRDHYKYLDGELTPPTVDDKARTLTVNTLSPNLLQQNVFIGSRMRALEVSEDRIVFEAPIKAYATYMFGLDILFNGDLIYRNDETGEEVRRPLRTHKALRVTWTRNQHPEYFAGLEPQE